MTTLQDMLGLVYGQSADQDGRNFEAVSAFARDASVPEGDRFTAMNDSVVRGHAHEDAGPLTETEFREFLADA